MVIPVEITGVSIRSSRTIPCYRTETGEAVSYSSDVTDHTLTVQTHMFMSVDVNDLLSEEDQVKEVVKYLESMVSHNVEIAAQAKINGGVSLPLPVKVEYGKVKPQTARVEGL